MRSSTKNEPQNPANDNEWLDLAIAHQYKVSLLEIPLLDIPMNIYLQLTTCCSIKTSNS